MNAFPWQARIIEATRRLCFEMHAIHLYAIILLAFPYL